MPTGHLFLDLNIFSRKIGQFECGEYVWEGENEGEPENRRVLGALSIGLGDGPLRGLISSTPMLESSGLSRLG